jgi:transcriptional regulator with XRE-family HTH domain
MEFGPRLRAAREARGWSLAQLAARIPADKGQLSRVERGQRTPGDGLVRRADELLQARGKLIAAAHLDAHAAPDPQPWETAELVQRLQASDTTPATLEAPHSAVVELCCDYGWRDAGELRTEGQR